MNLVALSSQLQYPLGPRVALPQKLSRVSERSYGHGRLQHEIALIALPGKSLSKPLPVNSALAGGQVVVTLATVVLDMSSQQAMPPAAKQIKCLAGGEPVVPGIIA